MSVIVRAATPDDREFLAAIATRLADFDVPDWRSAANIAAGDRRDLLLALDHLPAESALLVAEQDGIRAGVLHLLTRKDFFTLRPHGHISVIAITREAEGRGLGRALMAHAEQWSRERDYDRLTLSVFPANTRALALYERSGFAVDMLAMTKPLT